MENIVRRWDHKLTHLHIHINCSRNAFRWKLRKCHIFLIFYPIYIKVLPFFSKCNTLSNDLTYWTCTEFPLLVRLTKHNKFSSLSFYSYSCGCQEHPTENFKDLVIVFRTTVVVFAQGRTNQSGILDNLRFVYKPIDLIWRQTGRNFVRVGQLYQSARANILSKSSPGCIGLYYINYVFSWFL